MARSFGRHYAFRVTEAEFDGDLRAHSGTAFARLGRSPLQPAGPDQPVGWRPWGLLRRSQRSCARSAHATLRQRRHDGGSTAPVAHVKREPSHLKPFTMIRA